jgi:P4 family phage/plasmid primase-like protien
MNIEEEFATRQREHEERLQRQPTGDAPEVVDPGIEDLFEGNGAETDKRLADIFVSKYAHLFCNGDNRLHVYMAHAGRWVADSVEDCIAVLVMHMSHDYHRARLQVLTELEVAAREGRQQEIELLTRRRTHLDNMIKYCEKGGTIGTVSRLVVIKMKALLLKNPVSMNPDPCLLACKNGVVDLRTGLLHWPQLEDRLTHNTGVDYVPGGDYGWWAEKVRQIAGDDTTSEFLQVFFGYCATSYTREHCMAVMWGNGRNGKNILMDAVAGALGSYAVTLANAFLEAQGQVDVGNNVLYMMAQLHGKRFAYVSETGERGRLRESVVKSLTGDKTIRARLAHQNYFEFPVTHKFVIGTNHKPEISGTDDGVWERIRLVPMRVKFGEPEEVEAGTAQRLKDVGLSTELDKKARREEVLLWIVEGARKYISNGLRRYTPATIAAETKAYRREQDVLGQFLQAVSEPLTLDTVNAVQRRMESLAPRELGKWTDEMMLCVDKMALWRAYAFWAQDNGHGTMSSTMFARRITSAQRFWPGDGTGEVLMKALEAIRTNRGNRYRWFQWNDYGRIVHTEAERQHSRKVNTHERGEDPGF